MQATVDARLYEKVHAVNTWLEDPPCAVTNQIMTVIVLESARLQVMLSKT